MTLAEELATALKAAEIRLHDVRAEIVDLIDSGASNDHPIRLRQGDITKWFDTLECVSGILGSVRRSPNETAGLREALGWYESEAEAASRYMAQGKTTTADALLAILTVLANDGGRRARTALALATPSSSGAGGMRHHANETLEEQEYLLKHSATVPQGQEVDGSPTDKRIEVAQLLHSLGREGETTGDTFLRGLRALVAHPADAPAVALREALESLRVYRIEGDEDKIVLAFGRVQIASVYYSTEAGIALLKFDALQRAALGKREEIAQSAAQFVMWALMEGSWQGCDIDGGAAQDKAVELGLIVETPYDPVKHGEQPQLELGESWFVPSDALLSALPRPSPPASGMIEEGK